MADGNLRACGHPLGSTRWCPDCALIEDEQARERGRLLTARAPAPSQEVIAAAARATVFEGLTTDEPPYLLPSAKLRDALVRLRDALGGGRGGVLSELSELSDTLRPVAQIQRDDNKPEFSVNWLRVPGPNGTLLYRGDHVLDALAGRVQAPDVPFTFDAFGGQDHNHFTIGTYAPEGMHAPDPKCQACGGVGMVGVFSCICRLRESPGVPVGWKIVPVETTEVMEQAAFDEAGSPSDWYGLQDMWTAALAVAPAAPVVRATLPPLDDDLRKILGRPNFACIRIANDLRAVGFEIAHRSEDEQAAVLHYMLGFYLEHGAGWVDACSDDMVNRAKQAAAKLEAVQARKDDPEASHG